LPWLGWFVPREWIAGLPRVPQALGALTLLLLVLTFVLPLVLALRVYQGSRRVLPLTVVLLMVSNGLWWTALDALGAFVLATIAHGLQYLGGGGHDQRAPLRGRSAHLALAERRQRADPGGGGERCLTGARRVRDHRALRRTRRCLPLPRIPLFTNSSLRQGVDGVTTIEPGPAPPRFNPADTWSSSSWLFLCSA